MKSATERTLVTGIVIAIVSVVAFGIVSIWQTNRVQTTSAWIRHANQLVYQLQKVVDLGTQYEIDAKGFLLTGDSTLQRSLRNTAASLRKESTDLRELTVMDEGLRPAQVDSLLATITLNKDVLDRAIGGRLARGPAAATELLLKDGQTIISDRMRVLSTRLDTEEKALLDQHRQTSRQNISGLQGILAGMLGVLAIILIVFVFQKNRMALSREKKARERLNLFNRELEEKIRLATAGLRASEEKYRTIFYKSPLPKWVYDLETLEFREVNEAAIRNYGYSQEEFLRLKITDIRPKEDISPLMDEVRDVKAFGDDSRYGTWRHIKSNGELIYVEVTAHPMEYNERPARMVVVNDITERKRSEILLQQLNEDLLKRAAELASSNAELERFAYIASHDLQEPLRMVSSFLQLLKKKYQGQLDEKADRYIHYAVDGAERMKILIMDLLEYSRVGSGKENFEEVDTNRILEEVTETFRAQIIKNRARVEIDPLPAVTADRMQLSQLFQNMIGNAMKYRSEQSPVIRISVKEEPEHWQFCIRDNGIGIDPLYFEKIFIIFQRLHNKTDYSGTGIGLAICKKIVERHRGKIWVESAPGQGSAFFFTLSKHQ